MASLTTLTDKIFEALIEMGVDVTPIAMFGGKEANTAFMNKVLQALEDSEYLQEGTCGYNTDMKNNKLTTPGGLKETLQFVMENNPKLKKEEIKKEVKEIKELGKTLNEELCAKGKAYRKRRMAAGEKSSAYLSGRAVKVCKGQMSGTKKKKK